jgi:hypothetical protein
MKIFLSHSESDNELARELARHLKRRGLTVLNPSEDFAPGDNWALMLGNALQESDYIVFLLTPGAIEKEWLRKEIEFALGSKRHENRVFSVLVGPTLQIDVDMPWILMKLSHVQVNSAADLKDAAREIASQCAHLEESSSNA